jgi:hypothetical protein
MRLYKLLEKLTEDNEEITAQVFRDNLEKFRECDEFENCKVFVIDNPVFSVLKDGSTYDKETYIGEPMRTFQTFNIEIGKDFQKFAEGTVYLYHAYLRKDPENINNIDDLGIGVWSIPLGNNAQSSMFFPDLKTILIKFNPSVDNVKEIIRKRLDDLLEKGASHFNTPYEKVFMLKMAGNFLPDTLEEPNTI